MVFHGECQSGFKEEEKMSAAASVQGSQCRPSMAHGFNVINTKAVET